MILSARNADRLGHLRGELKNAQVMPLDVTDPDTVRKAAASVGPLDGVIYNAGTYEPMHATEWNSDAETT